MSYEHELLSTSNIFCQPSPFNLHKWEIPKIYYLVVPTYNVCNTKKGLCKIIGQVEEAKRRINGPNWWEMAA